MWSFFSLLMTLTIRCATSNSMGPGLGSHRACRSKACLRPHVTPSHPMPTSRSEPWCPSPQPQQGSHSKIKHIPTYLVPHLLSHSLLPKGQNTNMSPHAEGCPRPVVHVYIHQGALNTHQPTRGSGCSYLGEVSRLREMRAPGKSRVSQSLTSRSRICKEKQRGAQKGPSRNPRAKDMNWHRAIAPEQSLKGEAVTRVRGK